MTGQPAILSKVKRFTTDIVIPEDRMRLSVERDDGTPVMLWLTRRICIRLVPEIVKIVEKIPQLTGQGQGSLAPASANAQRQSQMQALGQIQPQPSVLSEALPGMPMTSHLVNGLQVQMRGKTVLIIFKEGDTVVQALPFSEEALRQWLGILHMNFRKAEWNDDIWPAWITAKGWDQGPDALRLN